MHTANNPTPRNRTLVRASDLSAWAYCQRAWWLANVQGAEHQEPHLLEQGRAAHATHGRGIAWAGRIQRAGIVALLVALGVVAVALALAPGS